MTSSDTHPAARIIGGRYQVGARRGSGLEVATFDAVDQDTGEPVVLKLVHPTLCEDVEFRQRFAAIMTEAETVHQPNLARVLKWGADYWNGRGVLYVVSEQLSGGSLRDLLDRGRVLSASQALMVGLEACKGLDALHRAGMVHGDIRPANLIFGADSRLRISDIGLSRAVGEGVWSDGGQPTQERATYASPERALSQPVVPESDVYSLALCVLEAATGKLPFVGDSAASTLANRVDRLLPVNADLGPLAAVLERAARPAPGDRFSAMGFGTALLQAAQRMPRPAPIPTLSGGLFGERGATDTTGPLGRTQPMRGGDLTPASGAALPPDAPAADVPVVDVPVADIPDTDVPDTGIPDTGIPDTDIPDTGIPDVAESPVPDTLDVAAQAEVVDVTDRPADDLTDAGDVITDEPTGDELAGDELAGDEPVGDEPVGDDGDRQAAQRRAVEQAAAQRRVLQGRVHEVPQQPRPVPTQVQPVTPSQPVPTQPTPVPRTQRRGWWWIAAALIALLGIGGGAAWYVASRPDHHLVPELGGRTEAEALQLLTPLQFQMVIARANDEQVDNGKIISTDPPAGTELTEGDEVKVLVSAGPKPRRVPSLVGVPYNEAQRQLEADGLKLARGVDVSDEEVPPGSIVSFVIDGSPTLKAGDSVARGTTIIASVSSGPKPRNAPQLVNLTTANATSVLEQLGLVLSIGAEESSSTVPAGTIISQSPVVNTPVPKGSTITVVVSKGPELVAVPNLDGMQADEMVRAINNAGLVFERGTNAFKLPLVSITIRGGVVTAGQQVPKGSPVVLNFTP